MVFPARILIVELETHLAENIQVFLDWGAAEVQVAPDIETAKTVLGSFVPDLVILDYELTEIDGLRAYEKICRFCPTAPRCVLVAGKITDIIVQRARQHGVYQILSKPFSVGELHDAINESVGGIQDPITGDRRVDERRSFLVVSRHLNRRLMWSRRDRPDIKYPGLIVAPEVPTFRAPGESMFADYAPIGKFRNRLV